MVSKNLTISDDSSYDVGCKCKHRSFEFGNSSGKNQYISEAEGRCQTRWIILFIYLYPYPKSLTHLAANLASVFKWFWCIIKQSSCVSFLFKPAFGEKQAAGLHLASFITRNRSKCVKICICVSNPRLILKEAHPEWYNTKKKKEVLVFWLCREQKQPAAATSIWCYSQQVGWQRGGSWPLSHPSGSRAGLKQHSVVGEGSMYCCCMPHLIPDPPNDSRDRYTPKSKQSSFSILS